MDAIKKIANPTDIDFRLAENSYRWNSMDSQRRAQQDQEDYVREVNGLYVKLLGECQTDEQRAVLDVEIERYRQGYLKHYNAVALARSRTANPMVTGPARFPVARNRKRMETEHKRSLEMLEWGRKARAAMARKIADARPIGIKKEEEWESLKRQIEQSLYSINGIDRGERGWSRALFVNSITGKVKRLAENGETGLVSLAMGLIEGYNQTHDRPAITHRHEFWSYGDLARERSGALQAQAAQAAETIAEADGIRVVKNHQLDRVQLFFDGKPDAATRDRLKRSGWHWSMREMAWQRKLTEMAVTDAKKFLTSDRATVE